MTAHAKTNAGAENAKAAPKTAAPVRAPEKAPARGAAAGMLVQRRGVGNAPRAVPDSVHQALAGPGQALDGGTRAFMESRFGRDFGGVRVHTGPTAAGSAKQVNARAYTVGQNIAFDDGEYRPHSRGGRMLLAHELAHTIQQLGGAAPLGGLTLDGGASDPLEREADHAALAAMTGTRPRIRPGVGGNQLSRAEREWDPDLLTDKLKDGAGVLRVSKKFKDEVSNQTAQAFDVGTFTVPGQKGNDKKVLEKWQERVTNGALESTITGVEPNKLLLKQQRPDTEKLRKIWIDKLGTDENALIAEWNTQARQPNKEDPLKDSFKPMLPGAASVAHMDHIVELQLGGNNTQENIQVLDATENMASGRIIYDGLKARAQAIRDAYPGKVPHKIVVHYSAVEAGGNYTFPDPSAYAIANKIEAAPPKATKDDVARWEPFRITAGGSTTLKLLPGTEAGKNDDQLHLRGKEATTQVNLAATTLIPGLLLTRFESRKNKEHKIAATFDNEEGSKSRIPFEPKKNDGADKNDDSKKKDALTISVGKDEQHKLKIDNKSSAIEFYYPYLSKGKIKTIEMRPDGIAGTATLTPSIKLIKQLDLEFSPNHLALITKIDKKKIDPGIPGLRITDAAILIDLYPDFKPSGRISFELGPAKKPFVDGFIEARKGADGFEAQGELHAHVPGLDEAKGDVFYKKQADGKYGWNGFVDLKSSKIPRTKNVAIHAEFGPGGWGLSGTLTIALPGKEEESEAKLEVEKKGEDWVCRGSAVWKPPVKALDPVKLHLAYNISKDRLSGWGETGLTFKGLHGTIKVDYDDGAISGEGKIDFKKGKASGTLNVKMSRAHKISGDGTIVYQVTPALTATGKVKVDENQDVLVEGLLEYKEPIKLFPQIKGDRNLLTFEQNVPVPGLSLGPSVGVQLKLTAALDAGFTVNPAELHNIKVGGKIKPFSPDSETTIFGHADFVCSAEVHITGTLGAGLALSVLIAEVSGNLGVSATAQLNASIKSPVDLKYEQDKFTADIGFEAKLGLAIILALKAWVIAKAGIGPFSVSTRWDWTLASYTYRPKAAQASLLLKKPLHYSSDGGLALPSWSDFDYKGPELDPADVVGSLFQNAEEKKKED